MRAGVLGLIVVAVACAAPLGACEDLAMDQVAIEEARRNYPRNLKALEEERSRLAEGYRDADPETAKGILSEARRTVLTVLHGDMFPAWYGTEWNFSGTTETPGDGTVACGYFVSTLLRDCGFRMNRYRVAQHASQRIVELFAEGPDTRILVGKPVSEVTKYISESGEGLYIVGLDTHVGFILHHEGSIRFVHSSYYRPPRCVVSEPAEGVNPLADSNYRVIGKILGDEMMRRWLVGEAFELE